jgi:cytochrome P450
MADHADVQDKLRSEIRSALADAAAEKRDPTIDEITKTNIPYLDATIEEILRRSFTVPSVSRVALNDTVVLGHHIPKGTELFFIGNGPSAISPAYEIADSLRSASYRAATERVGSWDPKDMGQFRPERWLVEKDGKTVFSANAGPLLVFGIGPRGCYGKRMAYLELRMSLVEIIWNFELQKCPEELSGHESLDRTVHAPQQCYVRLKSAR